MARCGAFVRWSAGLLGLAAAMVGTGCDRVGAQRKIAEGPTTVVVSNKVIRRDVKRLGMNLGGQSYWDSGQISRNLMFINPGFEGESWQSILRCKVVTATSCVDGNQWTQWPDGFLDGASFEVISGGAAGTTGMVSKSLAANSKEQDHGFAIQFAPTRTAIGVNDFVLVKKSMPGNAQAGWWVDSGGGGSFATEFKDLPAHTVGKQALKIVAHGVGQSASVSSYFDSMAGRSFVQLKGKYQLTFKAKVVAGNSRMHVVLQRQAERGRIVYLDKDVALGAEWRDVSMEFVGEDDGSPVGTVGLTFHVEGADVLLDDVSLMQVPGSKANPTAFRDEVVDALRELHPGVLRYNDGDHLGSSFDNMIAPVFGRVRAGYSERNHQQDSVPLGLPEFLQLCQVVGAEPWVNLPAGMSAAEAKNLVEYLGGPATSGYGAKRAATGQVAPWTSVFAAIHLELGNEEWNGPIFPGSAMPDPEAYGRRAKDVFSGARSSPFYQPDKFDLVMGTFVLMPDWTQKELANSGRYDSTAIAPYLMDALNDTSSEEAIFGSMFAEPEMIDSRATGYVAQQGKVAQGASARLSVYEVNLGTASGLASQAAVDSAVPSMGGALALMDHMLLMMRDVGVTTESIWALTGYQNGFDGQGARSAKKTPLFGTVIDMGGATNLKRPQFLAEELVNRAILPSMVETQITGVNPTWDQPLSTNNKIQLEKAHLLQTFAFVDGAKRSLVLLNLSRTDALPVVLAGDGAPVGSVEVTRLTAKKITDNNEAGSNVAISPPELMMGKSGQTVRLPPFSITVMTWAVGR